MVEQQARVIKVLPSKAAIRGGDAAGQAFAPGVEIWCAQCSPAGIGAGAYVPVARVPAPHGEPARLCDAEE